MTPTTRALLATVCDNPGDTTARMVYADALQDAGDEEGAAIQRAIAEPHNDGHRLALADALERTAVEEMECEACSGGGKVGYGNNGNPYMATCDECHGEGRVSDGRAEWSEFIRVQCELARSPATTQADHRCPVCRGNGRWRSGVGFEHEKRCGKCNEIWEPGETIKTRARKRLEDRERELWPAVRGRFEGYGVNLWCGKWPGGNVATPAALIQEGLPSVVRCTLAEWMGEPCEYCQGRGHRTLYGDGSGLWAKCQYCIDGRTPGIGPRLAQAWPLVRVEVTDAVIHPSGGNSTYYVGGLGIFPKEFWRRLEGHRTPSAARAALSDAAIEWARGQVIEETK